MTKRVAVMIFAVCAIIVGAVAYIYRPVSWSDRVDYGIPCQDWIRAEFNDGRSTSIRDAWRKRGHLVFEILAARESGNVASVYLCVINPKTGDLLKPSAFDTSWR